MNYFNQLLDEIGFNGVPRTVLECQVSKMANSDTCPRPTAGAPRGKWPSPTEANLREACEIAKRATQAAADANIVAGGSTDTPRENVVLQATSFWGLVAVMLPFVEAEMDWNLDILGREPKGSSMVEECDVSYTSVFKSSKTHLEFCRFGYIHTALVLHFGNFTTLLPKYMDPLLDSMVVPTGFRKNREDWFNSNVTAVLWSLYMLVTILIRVGQQRTAARFLDGWGYVPNKFGVPSI
jgi:hypothetical protein